MNLRHLRYFTVVAEELHFSRAAQRLHISQPPLSQAIRALEESLEVRLFRRGRGGVQLTEAGRQFLRRAYALLEQVDQAVSATRRAGFGEVGMLEIGFTGSMPFTDVMPRILRDFRAVHPDIQLHLREMTSRAQIDDLAAEKLDIGFIRPTRHEQTAVLEIKRVLREPLLVALHAGHRLARRRRLRLEMLSEESFITYSRWLGSDLHELVFRLCLNAGFTPRVVQEVREMPTVVGLVAAGLGIGLVGASVTRARWPYVVFRPIDDDAASTDALLVWRRDCERPAVAHFTRIARDMAAPGVPSERAESLARTAGGCRVGNVLRR